MHVQTSSLKHNKIILLIGLVVMLGGLTLFIYLGYYNRYWADDWCYNADLSRLGFWGTIKGYTYITTYASNRFSLTLFSGLLYFLGVFGVQAMTALVIVFWAWGLYRLLSNVNAMISLGLSKLHVLLMTTVVVYYSIYMAPHLYQSLYWRSGLLPYTAPIVFGVWVFALITRKSHTRSMIFITGVLASFAGGFSEAGSATLTSMIGAYVFACFIFRKTKWAKDALPTAIAALLASIVAMILLIASPTTSYRMGLYEGTASLAEFPRLLIYYTYEFLALNILNSTLTHLVIFGTLLTAGTLTFSSTDIRIKTGLWLAVCFLIAILTLVFVAASYSPSIYIEQGPPAPRTGIIPQFIFILGYGLIALISGIYFRQYIHGQRATWLLLAMLLLCYAYSARSVMTSAQKIPLYAERAAAWDERDLQIREAKEQSILEINVRGIDGLPVGGIRDFVDSRGSGFWVNKCAARYYGVDAIYATLP